MGNCHTAKSVLPMQQIPQDVFSPRGSETDFTSIPPPSIRVRPSLFANGRYTLGELAKMYDEAAAAIRAIHRNEDGATVRLKILTIFRALTAAEIAYMQEAGTLLSRSDFAPHTVVLQ